MLVGRQRDDESPNFMVGLREVALDPFHVPIHLRNNPVGSFAAFKFDYHEIAFRVLAEDIYLAGFSAVSYPGRTI